jgi:hypothetical protein
LRLTPWLGLMVVAVGCGDRGEGASYVVLDEPARAALVQVDVGGRVHTGALPLEVEAGAPVTLLTLQGRRPLRVDTGMVYEVSGPAADVRPWTLGGEVRSDVVEVAGPASVVRNLASALGTGAPEAWNGRWRLAGPDALLRLSWMGDVAEISQVSVVLTEPAREQARASWRQPALGVARTQTAPRGDVTLTALVGSYTSDGGHSLFLDAEGGFLLETGCDPSPVRGTYRKTGSRIDLDGTNLALTLDASGRLEAPGLVFLAGEEK